MDVVLFNPAPRSGWQAQRRVELPLSLLCPATPLDRQGYQVKIIDQFANPDWNKEFQETLHHKPICFGVTCMTGPQIFRALEVSQQFRKWHPQVPIVWGGIHPSLRPAQTLANPLVDIVVVGEGEVTFPELIRTLQTDGQLKNVEGIAFKENGQIHFTNPRQFVDLNEQRPLSYHLVQMKHYRRQLFGQDHISFNSSRGCTFGCVFCWEPAIHKRRWRAMEPEVVLSHLKRIIREHHLRGFLFTDDNFFLDLERAYQILEHIVRANLEISIAKLQIRADTICELDQDFLQLLVRAGVKRLHVGVESGSQRLLELLKKGETVAQIIAANRKLIPYPLVPLYLFMMGLPTETTADFAESVRLAIKLTTENPKAVKTFNIYTPYPGTELYEMCVKLGLQAPARLEDWAHFNYRNIPREAHWLNPEMKAMIRALDFPLMFLGKGHFITPYKKTNLLVQGLSRLYYPLAKYRVQHLWTRFPIESKVVKALGLFGRQD
ncbi:B12-binding domain-containing radical SAM protein [candidate division CSSED10-310 bacterium]|uniref:B12-binding domain-containing radical SAM protein n=1 Tax=candidate division CSSED10-310 bacterium TaxID=2855610 RepID=A0ABV6YYM6_UNCC1